MADDNLRRRLGLFPATSIVIANMIGAGVFTISGLLMSGLGNPLLMIALWGAGGIIALCGAISYGELGAAMPGAGGEYLFLSRLYHPVFGFLSGWVSFIVGFSAPIAASAMGFSEYFTRAFPAIPEWYDNQSIINSIPLQTLLPVLVIVLFTIIHYRGLKTGARVQNFLTIMKVMLMVILISAGFLSGKGNINNIFSGRLMTSGTEAWKTIGLSLMWIMFAYSGWNASTYIGSEIKNPSRNLPASLLLGTLIVIILYIGINMFYIYGAEPGSMNDVISVGGLAAGNLFGKKAGMLFSLLISFALFSSLSAFLIIGPRVYYSMARDGLFFRSLSKVHTKYGAPSNSVLIQGILACLMVISGTFEQVLTYMGFSLGIFPILTVAGVMKLRKTRPEAVRFKGYPWAQILYISTGILILGLSYMQRPVESSIALITVLAGIPAYYLFKKYGKLQDKPG